MREPPPDRPPTPLVWIAGRNLSRARLCLQLCLQLLPISPHMLPLPRRKYLLCLPRSHKIRPPRYLHLRTGLEGLKSLWSRSLCSILPTNRRPYRIASPLQSISLTTALLFLLGRVRLSVFCKIRLLSLPFQAELCQHNASLQYCLGHQYPLTFEGLNRGALQLPQEQCNALSTTVGTIQAKTGLLNKSKQSSVISTPPSYPRYGY